MALIGFHVYDKHTAVTKAVQEVHLSYNVKFKQAENKAKEEKIALLEAQQKERDKKDENIRSLNIKLGDAVRLLNARKGRSEDSREPTIVREACTGKELFREDGEFLIGEAARADQIVIERDYYYEQYERARLMIKRINDGR